MTYTIKLRRGLASDWTLVNPILAEGELGYELDTKYFKVGDGVTPWNGLVYTVDSDQYLPSAVGVLDGKILLTFAEGWIITDLPSGLPDPVGLPDGKFISTVGEEWVVVDSPISPDELPNPAGLPDGKILTTLAEAWVAGDAPPSGGGGGGFVGYINGVLVVGAGSNRLYNDTGAAIEISSIRFSVTAAPTGGPLTFDVNLNGTTIFTNPANRPSIPAGAVTSGAVVPDVTTWPAGQYLTVDVDLIGTTYAGANATAQIGV